MKPPNVAVLPDQSDDLLANFLAPSGTAEAPVSVYPERTKVKRRVSASQVKDAYERVGTTIALLGAGMVGIGLWGAGAYFTLQFLSHQVPTLAGMGVWAWVIPIVITAAELFLWPRWGGRMMQLVFFLGVLAFDVGSTYSGFVDIAAGRSIALFRGISIPQSGWVLDVLGVVAGLVCAFGPERIARWVMSDLIAIWKGVWKWS